MREKEKEKEKEKGSDERYFQLIEEMEEIIIFLRDWLRFNYLLIMLYHIFLIERKNKKEKVIFLILVSS